MHCPNCGTRFSTEQKFCRVCGLSLQPITQLTSQLLAENAHVSPAVPEMSQNTSEKNSRWSAWISFLGLFVFLCGLMLLTLNHVLDNDRVLDIPAVFTGLLGTFIALYGVLYPRLHAPKQNRSLTSATALPVAATTNDLGLLSGTIPDSSIVEHTTRHLEPILAEQDDRRNQ
ncbi:MAG TPA: zinc ribbon domain-containing protein [Blastocatellia bacterium]|nr:zinc ribbon domain-containing protein [Blastocatellia bacterium]